MATPDEQTRLERESALERLRTLLRIPTVSPDRAEDVDHEAFALFVSTLTELYPLAHAALERTEIAGGALLYRWQGAAADAPTVLMAHYDVVPAPADGWSHPPFEPTITGIGDDALLWGRGTLDDKGALAAIMEAVESELEAGFVPRHDIYLCFGHNEEVAGDGAREVAAELTRRGVAPAFVLDEGGAVIESFFPGVSDEVAVVGVSEKGITTLELSVAQSGGHASMPSKDIATDRLARAIVRLARHPFPVRLGTVSREMLRRIGARATNPYAQIYRRPDALAGPLGLVFARLGPETNAMVRTTAAVTQLGAGAAANALPERAWARVNIRIAVGTTLDQVRQHIVQAVRDPAIRIDVLPGASMASPVSPMSGPPWQRIASAIAASYPDALVVPYVMLGASDSRHFTRISPNVYRFTPFRMNAEIRGTLHAIDERLPLASWYRGIDFYRRVVTDS
ncbi:M20/M25/M40 family metallo-hydrolase [Microbacteriaceae bacterium VKM Ac-2855]|nr:M20/M25/M40 family metallo-hydrolase [Microbacteriaceae bacterium VKM Ac-2855]